MFKHPCWHLVYKQINVNIISKVIVIGHCVCISENYSYFVGTAFKHWTWTRLGAPGLWCWSSQARVCENKPPFKCASETFFWLSSAELTVSGGGSGQPFPSRGVLHPEDLHTLVLPYAQVELPSAVPVVPNPGRVKDLVLSLQLRADEHQDQKLGGFFLCDICI